MTNAFKHAFAGGLPGVVSIVLRQEGEEVLLKVTNNGVGGAAESRSAETAWQAPGFGSGIVSQLAERLDGLATRVTGPKGAVATFRVPAVRRMH